MFKIIGADGKEYGPVPADKIRDWITSRRADLQTKACREGETEWKTLGDFPEFAAPPPVATGTTAATGPAPAAAAVAPAAFTVPVAPAAGNVLADRGTRLVAQIIDFLAGCVAGIPGGVLLVLGGGRHGGPLAFAGIAVIVFGSLILLGIQIYLLTTNGQTVGKKLMNIRIVTWPDGADAGFVKAFLLRMFVNGLISAVPVLGFLYLLVDICFIFRDDRRCIHDLIAGTQVVTA
ncbi:MAG TPA: RDD family protein [Lacunisphaera sp.]|nr:RDD family protein [Lacunisphaera sp.]